jgi:hypothetical protein
MRSTGHIRRRSPSSFELRYSLGTNPATGERRIATATVRGTRKDAEKELRRVLEPIQEEGIHAEWVDRAKRRSMMRIMARRKKAATVLA